MSEQYFKDAENLPLSKLIKKYKLTYISWENMVGRGKKGLAVISQEFEEFPSFLKIVGVRKSKNYTLDRLDNSDPEYAEGKVDWRDKTAQNNNKSNNVFLVHVDGRKFTVAQWAKQLDIKADTLYKRRDAGWSDMEIINGYREKHQNRSISEDPFPYKHSKAWERKYKKAVLHSYNGNRMEYLRDRSAHELPLRKMGIEVIMLILNNAKENESQVNISSLEHYYRNCLEDEQTSKYKAVKKEIIKCKDLSSDELLKRKMRLQKLVNSYESILPQVQAQLEYDLKLMEQINKRAGDIDKSTIRKYYEELHPRPKYTINQPSN